MNIKSITLGLRAVASAFGLRLFKSTLPVLVAVASITVVVGVVLIGYVDAWWALLFVPVWIVVLLVSVALALAYGVIVLVRPSMSDEQRHQTGRIVDHLEVVRDVTGTPKLLIVLQLAWSVIRPQPNGYLQRLLGLKGVHTEFVTLVRSFGDRAK